MVKCPPFYFHDTGTDILLANNFLQMYVKSIYDNLRGQITFKTPCGHHIVVKRLKHAYGKRFPIDFKPRTAQRGDIGYKERVIFPKGTPLLKYQLQLRKLDVEIEHIKNKIKQCYSENPLQFWNKNQITTKLEMKDKNNEI